MSAEDQAVLEHVITHQAIRTPYSREQVIAAVTTERAYRNELRLPPLTPEVEAKILPLAIQAAIAVGGSLRDLLDAYHEISEVTRR